MGRLVFKTSEGLTKRSRVGSTPMRLRHTDVVVCKGHGTRNYLRIRVSKAKVRELTTMIGMSSRDFGRLLVAAGLDQADPDGDLAEVLLPDNEQ